MATEIQENKRAGESGNVLFLILIAVALFAALSYAVTQSTRSGSGDASGETNLINSAQLAQYPAGVRTSIVRMIISGASIDQIAFDAPSEFTAVAAADADALRYNVFHPTGGGAVFQKAPNGVMAANSGIASDDLGTWIFTSKYQIDGIGSTDASDPGANDIIAFLPGVSQNVCKKLNDELGIFADGDPDKIPVNPDMTTLVALADSMTTEAGDSPGKPGIGGGAATGILLAGTGDHPLQGQPFGCFKQADKMYVYYHVLVER